MQQSITTPRSIQGIKHTAAKLKRSLSLKTHEAQDLAAQQAGYANFKAARDTLPEKAFQVSLSCRWLDTITHLRGNETLTLHLTRPWFQISCPNAPHKATSCRARRQVTPMSPKLSTTLQKTSQVTRMLQSTFD